MAQSKIEYAFIALFRRLKTSRLFHYINKNTFQFRWKHLKLLDGCYWKSKKAWFEIWFYLQTRLISFLNIFSKNHFEVVKNIHESSKDIWKSLHIKMLVDCNRRQWNPTRFLVMISIFCFNFHLICKGNIDNTSFIFETSVGIILATHGPDNMYKVQNKINK